MVNRENLYLKLAENEYDSYLMWRYRKEIKTFIRILENFRNSGPPTTVNEVIELTASVKTFMGDMA